MIENLKAREDVEREAEDDVQRAFGSSYTARQVAEFRAYARKHAMNWYLRGAANATGNRVVTGAAGTVLGVTTSPVEPIPMRLHCPDCGTLHVDEGAFTEKSHHTHACQVCGNAWRPAIAPTIGVRFLPGFKNEDGPKTDQPAVDEDALEEARDDGYVQGRRMANLFMLGKLLGDLKDDGGITGGNMLQKARELEEARLMARGLCAKMGVDWPGDDLHFGDIVSKTIGRKVESMLDQLEDAGERALGEDR